MSIQRPSVVLPLYGQLRDRVSYSELRLFSECQWKWALTHLYKMAPEDQGSLALAFGSAVHSGMEVLYGSGEPDADAAAAHALSELERNVSTVRLEGADVKEYERLKLLFSTIFRDALLCEDLQGIRPLRSELMLLQPIDRSDGLEVNFKGFIDIIFVKKLKKKSVIYIADFKTCTWGWPAKKLMDPEVCAQILLYKHFFVKLTGADPRNVTAAFILLKKTPAKGEPSVEVAKIGAGPKAVQAAIDYLQDSITGMHSGRYEKNFDSCRRTWIDKETEEEREARCPFFGTESCEGSAD